MTSGGNNHNENERHRLTAISLATERFEALENRLSDVNRTFVDLLRMAAETKATLEFHIKEENFKQEEMKASIEKLYEIIKPVVTERQAAGTLFSTVRNWAALIGALAVLAGALTWLWDRIRSVIFH